jgi:hypothetical protein
MLGSASWLTSVRFAPVIGPPATRRRRELFSCLRVGICRSRVLILEREQVRAWWVGVAAWIVSSLAGPAWSGRRYWRPMVRVLLVLVVLGVLFWLLCWFIAEPTNWGLHQAFQWMLFVPIVAGFLWLGVLVIGRLWASRSIVDPEPRRVRPGAP